MAAVSSGLAIDQDMERARVLVVAQAEGFIDP
jgi:hypothetical protein